VEIKQDAQGPYIKVEYGHVPAVIRQKIAEYAKQHDLKPEDLMPPELREHMRDGKPAQGDGPQGRHDRNLKAGTIIRLPDPSRQPTAPGEKAWQEPSGGWVANAAKRKGPPMVSGQAKVDRQTEGSNTQGAERAAATPAAQTPAGGAITSFKEYVVGLANRTTPAIGTLSTALADTLKSLPAEMPLEQRRAVRKELENFVNDLGPDGKPLPQGRRPFEDNINATVDVIKKYGKGLLAAADEWVKEPRVVQPNQREPFFARARAGSA
jgi:hypothetical protein